MTALMRNVHMRGLSPHEKKRRELRELSRMESVSIHGIRVCAVVLRQERDHPAKPAHLRQAPSSPVNSSQTQSCMQASQSGFGSRVGQPGTRNSEPPSEGGTKRRDANCANCREWNPVNPWNSWWFSDKSGIIQRSQHTSDKPRPALSTRVRLSQGQSCMQVSRRRQSESVLVYPSCLR